MSLPSGWPIAGLGLALHACGLTSEGTAPAEAPTPAPTEPRTVSPESKPEPETTSPSRARPGGLADQVTAMRKELDTPTATWTTYQGDPQRSGRSTSAPAIGSPRIRWKAEVGIQGYLNAPLVLGSTVVVPSSGTRHNMPDPSDGLHALELTTGGSRWRAPSGSDANGATATDELVIFTSDDGKIRGVVRATGVERWSTQRGGAVYSTPLTLGSQVIVGDASGHVVALDATTGAEQWTKRYTGAIRGGLASDGKHAFVASQGGDVAAIDPSGREVWREAVTRPGWDGGPSVPIEGYNAPVVDGARLVVPFARDTYYDSGPALLALSVVDGHELWRATPGPSRESWGNLRSSPALADGVLLWAEPYSGDVAALDTSSGVVRYRVTVGQCLFPQYGSPVIAGDTAYVPRQDGRLYAMEASTGMLRWTMDLSAAATAGPVRGGTATGSCDWDGPGAPLYAPPAIAADGTVLVGSGEGFIYAIEDAQGSETGA